MNHILYHKLENILQAYSNRTNGNEAFIKGDYYEALCNYNESLMHANKLKLKEFMGLLYANRSAAYFKVNQYEKCLLNIKLARKNGYPAVKLQKLEARKKKCHEMIEKQQQQDPGDDPKDFIKLSYPADEKIPFIVNCLEIRDGEQQKRGIYTKQDLKAGDIVAIEKPIFSTMTDFHLHCAICWKTNMLNLIPGDLRSMFCSTKCRNEYSRMAACYSPNCDLHESFMKALYISGGFEKLYKIHTDSTKRTVFDFDLSKPDDAETKINMLKCAASFKKYEFNSSEASKNYQALFLKYVGMIKTFSISRRKKKILTEVDSRMKLISSGNAIRFKEMNHALTVFLSLVNHSCDPNIDIKSASGSFVAIINRPLKAGDQLFKAICRPFDEFPRAERMAAIMRKQSFQCGCLACVKDYPMLEELPVKDPDFNMPTTRFGTVKETVEELKKNWKYLTDNMKHHPSLETCSLLRRNRDLLLRMEDLADCPFKKTEPY